MALILGYYEKHNLGDEQYKITIKDFLINSGFYGKLTFTNPHSMAKQSLSTYSIIICGGGDIINDWFKPAFKAVITRFRGPVIALSIGITYPSTIKTEYLSMFDHITLRHKTLMDDVASIVGYSGVESIPDLGFSLPMVESPIVFDKKRIGIFLANKYNYTPNLIATIVKLSKEYDVVLYSMNTSQESHEGDSFINETFLQECVGSSAITIAPDLSLDELLRHIAGMEMTICVRYHAQIFSMTQEVPFVNISHTPKTSYLNLEYGIEDVYPWNGHVDVETYIYDILNNRQKYVDKIKERMSNIRLILENYSVPTIKRSVEVMMEESYAMLVDGESKEDIANYILINIVGTRINDYRYGLLNHLSLFDISTRKWDKKIAKWVLAPAIVLSYKNTLKDMIKWIMQDIKSHAHATGLTFVQSVDVFKGVHRSGWEMATKMLQVLKDDNNGILTDLYVDGTFHWNEQDYIYKGLIPYKQKWIGFVHHTPHEDDTAHNLITMFNKPTFLQSLHHCKLLLVLSKYLKQWLDAKLLSIEHSHVKTAVVYHPTAYSDCTFNFRQWLDVPTFTQVGAWLRNTYAIYAIKLPWGIKQVLEGPKMEAYQHPKDWFVANTLTCNCHENTSQVITSESCISREPHIKQRVNKMTKYMTTYIRRKYNMPIQFEIRSGNVCCNQSQTDIPYNPHFDYRIVNNDLHKNYNSVLKLHNMPNDQYDDLLSNTVVFVYLVDCSAANTIIECMIRNTPIIVNRLPAVVEYLGPDYPGYYTQLSQVWRLCNPNTIYRMHTYLCNLPKSKIMFDTFVSDVRASLSNIGL